ncbi:sensor histidine kinase [Nocardioides plantarum]|uniref:histidine kinase n=1 Tax=Nocardioides plantarum TaxID=29299 RepID=A0ABV5K8G9_9ACTN|nr:HAMP domain-containing sensor histidine kinase [Nocardioides plantarum]
MTRRTPDGLHTPSLRRRVTWVVLAAVTLMLLVLGVTTDLVLEARLNGQQRERLVDRARVADALVDQVDGRDLARRLEGDGVSVVLIGPDGDVYAEGPLAGGAAADDRPAGTPPSQQAEQPQAPGSAARPQDGRAPTPPSRPAPRSEDPEVVESGDLLTVTRDLADGSRVELLSDTSDVQDTLGQVRLALLLGALLVLLAAAVAVPLVVGRALAPLGRITEAARSITGGDRGRRLRPSPATSELGRTATAFDDMLDELVGAEARARAAEDRIRTFLSDAAHDLRTPLTGAQAAAELVLRDDPPKAERERVLTTAVREARRAGRLVDDMLLMARIDQGLTLRRDPVDLHEVAAAVVAAREPTAPDVPIALTGAPCTVTGDRDRLSRLLGNLVDNAVNAVRTVPAATAGPRVRIEVGTVGGTVGRWVEVVVRDDGPGVGVGDRERIFDRMVRLDGSRADVEGAAASGSGLGLPIARGIARAHGGDLVCEPTGPEGRGAVFRLTLPGSPTAGA